MVLKWGILGTGNIAQKLISAIKASEQGAVNAIASRDASKAESIATEHGIPIAYGSYEELVNSNDIDVVYIALPNALHCPWVKKAVENGKHILCEKPFTLLVDEARKLQQLIHANQVAFMEGYMYLYHPLAKKLFQIVEQALIGAIQFIDASYSFNLKKHPATAGNPIYFSKALGGGAILNLGGYPISLLGTLVGRIHGKSYISPEIMTKYIDWCPEEGIDNTATAILSYGDIKARVMTSCVLDYNSTLVIYGEHGKIVVEDLWLPKKDSHVIHVFVDGNREIFTIESQKNLYTYEVDVMNNLIAERQANIMSLNDSVANMQTLTDWIN